MREQATLRYFIFDVEELDRTARHGPFLLLVREGSAQATEEPDGLDSGRGVEAQESLGQGHDVGQGGGSGGREPQRTATVQGGAMA